MSLGRDDRFDSTLIVVRQDGQDVAWNGNIRGLVWNAATMEWIAQVPQIAASGGSTGGLTNTELRLAPVAVSLTTGFSTVSASSAISVGITSTTLILANTSRKYLHIFNNSSAAAYIQYGSAAVLNRGIKLNAGGLLTLSGYELFLGQINAISTTTINLDILEGV